MEWVIWIPLIAGIVSITVIISAAIIWYRRMNKIFNRLEKQINEFERWLMDMAKPELPSNRDD